MRFVLLTFVCRETVILLDLDVLLVDDVFQDVALNGFFEHVEAIVVFLNVVGELFRKLSRLSLSLLVIFLGYVQWVRPVDGLSVLA